MTSEAKIDIRVDDTQVEQLTRSLDNLQRSAQSTGRGFNTVEREANQASADLGKMSRSVRQLDTSLGSLGRGLRSAGNGFTSIGRIAAGTALGVAGLDTAVAAIQKSFELATSSVAAYAQQNTQLQTSLTNLQATSQRAQLALGGLIVNALGGVQAFESLEDVAEQVAIGLEILSEAFSENALGADGFGVAARDLALGLNDLLQVLIAVYNGIELTVGAFRLLIPGDNYGLDNFNDALERTYQRFNRGQQRRRFIEDFEIIADEASNAADETERFNRALGGVRTSLGSLDGATIQLEQPAQDFAAQAAELEQTAQENAQTYLSVFQAARDGINENIVTLADRYMDMAEAIGGQEGLNRMADIFFNPNSRILRSDRQLGLLGGVAEGMGDIPEQIRRNEVRRKQLQDQIDELTAQRDAEAARAAAAAARTREAEAQVEAERQRARRLQVEAAQSRREADQAARELAGIDPTGQALGQAIATGIVSGIGVGALGFDLTGRGANLSGRAANAAFGGGIRAGGAIARTGAAVGGTVGGTMVQLGGGAVMRSARALMPVGRALGTAGRAITGPVGIGAGALIGGAVGGRLGFEQAFNREQELQNLQFDAMVRANRLNAEAARQRAQAQEANISLTQAELELQRARTDEISTQEELDNRLALLGINLLNTERERDRLARAAGPQLEQYNEALQTSVDLAQDGLDIDEQRAQIAFGEIAGAARGAPVVAVAQGIATGTAVRSQADISRLQESARTLRTGFGMRGDIDRVQGIRQFEQDEFSTLSEAEDALIASLNNRERAFIDAETSIYDYIDAVNEMKAQTRDAFRTEGIDAFVTTFEAFGSAIGNAIGGGFDDGLSAGEKAKIVLFDLLGSVLKAIGSTAIAQGVITAVGDPMIGGFPNPARGAALIAAGTAAVAAGTAFSARAGNIGSGAGAGAGVAGPGAATVPGREGGGEAITNIIVQNRFGSRFDAREMDRAAATSFERAAAAGQA